MNSSRTSHRENIDSGVTSPTLNLTDSIENQKLPKIPIHEESSFGESMSCRETQRNDELLSRIELPSKPITGMSISELRRNHRQRRAYSVPKMGQTYSGYSQYSKLNYNVIDKTSSPYIKSKALNLNRFAIATWRPPYNKLETANEDRENIELEPKQYIQLPKLHSEEIRFLQIVSEDNVDEVQKYLKEHPGMNINCTNFQGVSAIYTAVRNRSEAMVEFLLKYSNLEIGDSVLQAIRDNSIKILEMLLNAQQKISPGLEFAGTTHSADFPSHVTPLILAAQMGHYEIVSLLIEREHSIPRPHTPYCSCKSCRNCMVNDDALYISSARLSVYRAISSPVYLIHVSSDPILAAFLLTAELTANATAYRPLATAYLQLANDVSAFAVDLIGCCRTAEEVEFILKQTTDRKGRRHFVLPRLLMAIDYKQKEFVAHPNTQQVLESYWLGDWHDWKHRNILSKACTILRRIFITPIILLVCMVAPRHSLVTHWEIPLNKLITHVAAYFVFLTLVFYISNQDKSGQKRGPPNTGAEGPLILFVCGYTWSAIRMCFMQGPRRYFSKFSNWAEIIMLLLFGLTFIFWVASAIDVATNDDENLETRCTEIGYCRTSGIENGYRINRDLRKVGVQIVGLEQNYVPPKTPLLTSLKLYRRDTKRKYWNQHDPTLLAEGTFCLATIFAFFRLMFLCKLNYHLGPLQVSLGKMTIDIYKYIIVFAIIISAFTAGLARFYQYYDGMVFEDEFGMKTVQVSSFTSLSDTLNTLFWALFCMAPLESADVVLENTRDLNNMDKSRQNRHAYTEQIGYFCFGCFEVISVIVVLNMLIATMSNTFQRVTDNVDIEWTFGRTEVYIDYMLQTTLPSPFNLIPTASGMESVIEWVWSRIKQPTGVRAKWSFPYCCYIERDSEANIQIEYPALMSVLVQRYFRDKESSKMCNNSMENELEVIRRNLDSIKASLEMAQ